MSAKKRSVARLLLAAVSAAGVCDFCAQKSSAATTWKNTGTSWNSSGNWSSGIPSSSLSAWFPAAATVVTPNIASNIVTPQGIFIDNSGGGSYSISASNTISQTSVTYNGTITLGSGSFDVTGGGITNIKANLGISGATLFTADTGNTTSILGKFSGGSGTTITKAGSGTLQFQQAAASTASLNVSLTGGVLEVENNFALGTAPSITVGSGAIFQIDPTLNFNFGSPYDTPNGFGDASTQTILQNGATLRDGASGSNVALDLPLYGTVKVQNGAAVSITLPTNGAFDLAQAVQNSSDAPSGTTSNIHVTGAGIFTLNGASPATGAYTGTWNIDHGTSGGLTGITFLNNPTALGVSGSGYAAGVTLTSGILSDVRSTAASPVPNPITFAGGVLDAKATDGSGTSRTNSYFTGAINIQSVGGSTISLADPAYSDLSGPVCGMTLSGVIGGAGTLYLTAPTINPTSAGVVAFTNISTATPNTLSGNLIVQWDTALSATTTTSGSDPLGSATVSLAGGELRLSDAGSGSNGTITAFANNNITLRGYANADLPSQTDHNGTLILDNNSTGNTNNVIQLNQLTFDSSGTSAAQTLTVQNASATPNDSAKFTGTTTISGTATLTTGTNPANIELAGKLTGTGTFIKAGNNTLTLSGINSDFSGTTTISAGTAIFNSTYKIGTLTINSGADASVSSNGTRLLKVSGLSITSGGTLDLNDNYSIVSNGSLSTIKGLITTAYANGTWTGSGLTSSAARTVAANAGNIHKTALGYATDSQLGIGTFDGEPVSGSNILVRYTLSGDATLDDTVNSSDFAILAANYGSTNATWAMGDFNYDGTVNALDFNLLATNYGAAPVSGAVPEMALSLGSVVPEPSSFLIALMAALPAARRHRRKR